MLDRPVMGYLYELSHWIHCEVRSNQIYTIATNVSRLLLFQNVMSNTWPKSEGDKANLRSQTQSAVAREVPAQEGTSLAKELGCEFIETSAKDGTNVEEAFRELVRTNRRLEKQQKSQSDLGSIKENLDSRFEPIGRKKS
jgi:hypothetical protein